MTLKIRETISFRRQLVKVLKLIWVIRKQYVDVEILEIQAQLH